MRSRSFSCSAIAMALGLVLTLALACHSTFAFDLNDDSEKSRSPFELFKFGFSAYKNGHKDEAIKALRYAAERGHQGAKWKLARMYAEGDGVAEDDYEAYKILRRSFVTARTRLRKRSLRRRCACRACRLCEKRHSRLAGSGQPQHGA